MDRAAILGLVNPLIATVFAITFFVLWSRQADKQYILAFAFAYLMLGTGFFISHLAADTNGQLHVFGTNLFFCLGAMAMVWGATYRIGAKSGLAYLSALSILAGLLLVFFRESSDFTNLRLYITNTSYGFMFATGALLLFRKAKGGSINNLIIVMFALTAVQFWVRPAVSLYFEGNVDWHGYRDSLYYSILNVTIALLSLILAISLIAACVSDMLIEVRKSGDTDHLSGLKIRRAFEEEVGPFLAKRERSPLPVAIVVADIDHFKQLNDQFGHQAGDLVIAAFGRLLKHSSRSGDLLGRVGGEEFCVLLWNCDLQGARLFAEGLRTKFAARSFSGLKEDIRMTASFGAAIIGKNESYEDAFARADKALYEAKNDGRNKVSVCVVDRDAPLVTAFG